MSRTLFEKIWDTHLVHEQDGNSILYIDRHLVHEVTSPQAFEGLRMAGRKVRVPQATFAVPDHNIPTRNQLQPIKDPVSAKQVETLRKNCKDFGVPLFDLGDPPGDCPCDGSGAGVDPSGVDHRLRRFTYSHPRGFRSPCIRHRHFRSRTCDGNPDTSAKKTENDAGGSQRDPSG